MDKKEDSRHIATALNSKDPIEDELCKKAYVNILAYKHKLHWTTSNMARQILVYIAGNDDRMKEFIKEITR